MQEFRRAEHITTQLWGGSLQPRSGGGPFHKGDNKTHEFLQEVKQTDKQSYSLSLKTIEKIMLQALHEGRKAMGIIQFEDKLSTRVAWMLERDQLNLYKELEELRSKCQE